MRTIEFAYKKIKNSHIDAGAVFFFAVVLSFTVFAGQFLNASLSRGADNLKERLGADIAVVPRGQETSYQGIILSGEPIVCAIDASLGDTIRGTKGIAKVTPVIYLASLNASCCSVPVQLIGYDPETDFVTAPWIAEQYEADVTNGNLVVGHNIPVDEGNQISFFGKTYQVEARLHKTGTGMDRSVYVTFDVMEQMIRDAKEKGIEFESAATGGDSESGPQIPSGEKITDRYVSAFLIRVEEGADPDSVAGYLLRNTAEGVVQSKNLLNTASNGMSFFSKVIFWITMGMMLLVCTVTAVLHVFRINVRKKEWAVLMMMGASGKYVMRLILTETALLSIGGAVVGNACAALFILPFQELIAEKIELPFYAPDFGQIATGILLSVFLTLTAAGLPGIVAAALAAQTDCHELMREGES